MDARIYPPEFRAKVVADYLAGLSLRAAARKHDVSTEAVRRWVPSDKIRHPKQAALDSCTVEDCARPYMARGYCSLHYGREILGHKPRGYVISFDRDDRLEDCRWMAEHGESLTGAAKRIGITTNALETWLRKHDPDTLRPLLARDVVPMESRATFHGVAS